MKISYSWLKWYIPDAPSADKLRDIFTYHICEVENAEKKPDGDTIFDLNILPNRAHDLLSHQGVARELASLLNINFVDPEEKYKIPESKPTNLKIEINTEKCNRYAGRIIRNIKVGQSPDWVVKHLESIGQRSINNIVDAANLVMFDCGQPVHAFDLDKMKSEIIVRDAKDGENITTLDNREMKLKSSNMIIADTENVLGIAGIKGGKIAEVNNNTKNIVIEIANFDPVSVRKTGQSLNIVTDARKRFENDLSPEIVPYAMLELSATVLEMCPDAVFEDIVDIYPNKKEERKLSFSSDRISKILGAEVSINQIEDILKRYNLKYAESIGIFEIKVPYMRLDLTIEEDMAEEIGRILGYDKVEPKIPKINFAPKLNEAYSKISRARSRLLGEGYSEVMTYVFRDKGDIEVMQSASDKKFLRTNLEDGLRESLKLNQINAPLLGLNQAKIFEIGTVFKKSGEKMHVVFGEMKNIKEISLDDYCKDMPSDFSPEPGTYNPETKFRMWSLFPFIARDVAVWVPEGVSSSEVEKIIRDNAGGLVVRGPELFDEFKKDGKISYAFRLVFQSYERTLTDAEVNKTMDEINNKIKENNSWQVR